MSGTPEPAAARLNQLLVDASLPPLRAELADRFHAYLSLILRWNARVNLTAIRDQDAILSRHFVESIACAHALPETARTLLDFGSGAGFPGIPIALCRPDIAVTLAESQNKKASFLQEAVRVLELSTRVYPGRAEILTDLFECVTLRAVDKMPEAVKSASTLVCPGGTLALMTTRSDLAVLQTAAGASFTWAEFVPLPGSEDRLIAFGVQTHPPTESREASQNIQDPKI